MKLRSVALFGIAGIVVAAASHLTAPQSKRPEFEVASMKPNASGDHRVVTQYARGRLIVTGATLKDLMRAAYQLSDSQIIGGPSWMSSNRWDVQAKAEETASQKQINEMLQRLLVERFQLKSHKETITGPVYDLVIVKSGPRFSETKPDSRNSGHDSQGSQARTSHGAGGHTVGKSMTMAQLAEMLAGFVGRPVIDKTGLRGQYDIALSWTPDPGQTAALADHTSPRRAETEATPSDPNAPSLFTAIQEQLGLKMQSAKGRVEVLAVDGAQKPNEQK